jgi:hypothetical protein
MLVEKALRIKHPKPIDKPNAECFNSSVHLSVGIIKDSETFGVLLRIDEMLRK